MRPSFAASRGAHKSLSLLKSFEHVLLHKFEKKLDACRTQMWPSFAHVNSTHWLEFMRVCERVCLCVCVCVCVCVLPLTGSQASCGVKTLRHAATPCNTVTQHTHATRPTSRGHETLHHTSTHCNTLHHTAPHTLCDDSESVDEDNVRRCYVRWRPRPQSLHLLLCR